MIAEEFEPIARILAEPVARHFAQLFERHIHRLGAEFDDAADRCRVFRSDVVHGSQRRAAFRDEVDRAGEIARVNIGLLRLAAAVQRQLVADEPAQDRLRHHAMQQLPGTISVGRPQDRHRELQIFRDRQQIHVERDLRGRVGARRFDRLVLGHGAIYRPIHFGGADLNEALQPVALHQFLGQARERHRIGFEEAPGVLPRDRAFTLRGEIDDDLGFLAIKQF